jgi:hypothetical protein
MESAGGTVGSTPLGGGAAVLAVTVEPPDVDSSILPIGYLGLCAPMNSLGFALNPGLGLVYDEVLALLPAQSLVFSFQQRRAAEDARRLPYDVAAGREGVRVLRLADIERIELVRPVTGHRLLLTIGGAEQRWILQPNDIDEVRRVLAQALSERFVDSSS